MKEQQKLIAELRKDFPLLDDNVAYLDNAATTQKPRQVLDAVREYYEKSNSNPFRGVYRLSEASTNEYESSRRAVAGFVNAKSPDEIIFTRNATESLNLVAYSYGTANIKAGDEIVVSVMEHHSNFLPWKKLADEKGAVLRKLCPNDDGEVTIEALETVLCERTKIVALTQTSNVLGRVNDIKKLAKLVHSYGAVLVADGAQSVPHMSVDVQDLDVDFLAFSGHKMLAPMGVGVLYGKMNLLEDMPPFLNGGEMIETVHWDRVTYAPVPHKFEAGTVNAGGAVGLKAAIKYIENVGFETIHAQEQALTAMAMDGLSSMKGVHVVGSEKPENHCGIVTFTIDGVHPHDIASILDSKGICVRAGHHCAQPLMDFLGINSTTRASFAFYNTRDEVLRFLDGIGEVRRLMGYGE